jgi:hypothetical protein
VHSSSGPTRPGSNFTWIGALVKAKDSLERVGQIVLCEAKTWSDKRHDSLSELYRASAMRRQLLTPPFGG